MACTWRLAGIHLDARPRLLPVVITGDQGEPAPEAITDALEPLTTEPLPRDPSSDSVVHWGVRFHAAACGLDLQVEVRTKGLDGASTAQRPEAPRADVRRPGRAEGHPRDHGVPAIGALDRGVSGPEVLALGWLGVAHLNPDPEAGDPEARL